MAFVGKLVYIVHRANFQVTRRYERAACNFRRGAPGFCGFIATGVIRIV